MGLTQIEKSSRSKLWKMVYFWILQLLLEVTFIVSTKRFRYWIEKYCISDHSPILCLHIDFEVEQGNYPFKFNHTWIVN